MTLHSILGVDPLFIVYIVAFGGAASACFVSVSRARYIEDRDIRRGLVALLLTSGGWAASHVAFFVAPTSQLKVVFYVIGLIIGFSTLGPWLYFCSAYTGRSLHRNKTYQRAAVVVFLGVVLLKITNPIHHMYFTSEFVTTPFPHLAVHNQTIHWIIMGLSYALASVGYFMLFEMFTQVSYDTKPLVALVAITGLPVILDVIGLASPYLIDITYEPIGVAAFAIGVLFVFLSRFQAVQLAGRRDEPVIVLDDEGQVRDYNDSARDLFPQLRNMSVIGEPLDEVLPQVTEPLNKDNPIIEIERNGFTRYYRLSTNPFAAGRTDLGRLITITDITEREQYRRELERQNERLEQFASMVSHDLRNPLNVAEGRLDLARKEHDNEHLEAAANALNRMEELIEDVLALARQGQPIDETEEIRLSSLVEQSWEVIDTSESQLEIEEDITFMADPNRVQQMLENLFRNAIEHGGKDVTIRVGALDDTGFYVEDNGSGIPEEERDKVLESGYSTAEEGTGFGLAIVKEIADAHGWNINITESDEGGARFEIRGVN